MKRRSTLSVSVVVPTYKRPDLLERCLLALTQQSLAHDLYEIVVCDDGPSAMAKAVVDAAAQRAGRSPRIRYLAITGTQGPAAARNAGWRAAEGKIIAFTDDDTVPEPTWLQAGADAMASGAAAAVGRIVMPLPPDPSDQERDASHLQDAEFATANCFVRRDALDAVGGFDERFTIAWREDSDLHFALLRRGYTIVSAPAATIIHPLRPARFGAGIGMQRKVMFDVLLYRKHPELYRERIRHGPPWFYLLVSLSLLAVAGGLIANRPALAAVAAGCWAVLSLLFFGWRLSHSSFTLRNAGELLVTSAVIPPLSIWWRAVGMARFGGGLP